MTEVAHKPDCTCEGCGTGRPSEYKAVVARVWEDDAREAGKIHNATGKSLWHVAYLVALHTEPSKGGRPSSKVQDALAVSSKVSFRKFAEVAKLTDVTIGRYYATWQAAAQAGLVPDASTLGNSEPKAVLAKVNTDDWASYYPKKETQPATSNGGSKASGAKAPSRATKSADRMAKDRSPAPDATDLPGKPTGSRDPVEVITVTRDQVVTSPDSFALETVKDATTGTRILKTVLEDDGPFDDDMLKALEDFFTAVEAVKDLVMPRILGNQPKPSATVVKK